MLVELGCWKYITGLYFCSAVVPGVRHKKGKYVYKQRTLSGAGGLESKDVWVFSAPEGKTAAAE